MDHKKLMYMLFFMDKLEKAYIELEKDDLESMFKRSEKIEITVKK
jgi:hypothetical protein